MWFLNLSKPWMLMLLSDNNFPTLREKSSENSRGTISKGDFYGFLNSYVTIDLIHKTFF